MAATVLIDHGVKEDYIVVVSYLSSLTGLRRLSKAFPNMKIVTGCLKEGFERRWVDTRSVNPPRFYESQTEYCSSRYFGC